MNKLNNCVINKVLDKFVLTPPAIDNQWVILIKDSMFIPDRTTCFFETKQKAWKKWYCCTNWIIIRRYKEDYAESKGYPCYWEYHGGYPMTDREIWEAFKTTMTEEYNFRIIQWKDAKIELGLNK